MDYAEYVSRRPPSPPNLSHKDRPFTPTPSLSSTTSTFSLTLSHLSSASDPRSRRTSSLRLSDRPPPDDLRTTATLSASLHARALRDEYAALAATVELAEHPDALRDRQESVRIRLEHMLTRADPRSLRVLHLALAKCNAKLDTLAAAARRVDDARARMRVIESKHFLGARAPSPRLPDLRTHHIRRERVATLVEHIQCALHDQVRLHHLLAALADKLAALRTALPALDRPARPTHSPTRPHEPDRKDALAPPSPPARDSFSVDAQRRFARRGSRGTLRPDAASSERSSRASALRSQRSLPRRSDARLIPLVKRALSYNASGLAPPPTPPGRASWWGDTVPNAGRSEPRLSMPDAPRRRDVSPARDSAVLAAHRARVRETDTVPFLEPEQLPASPVSMSTAASDCSPPAEPRHRSRLQSSDVGYDQSVLVDVDSLCTEASSVLSSSRGLVDTPAKKSARRDSVSSAKFHATASGDSMRSKTLAKLKLSKIRAPSQIKKLWQEINELYGVILTHGPHLVEEKIAPRASVATGILGPWNSRRGKSATFRSGLLMSSVVEAIRKVESILLWQQRLIVAIRKDLQEQRKVLRQADTVISHAYMRSLDSQQLNDPYKGSLQ